MEKKLGSSPDGLTQAEAQKRLAQYGPNEIAEKKTNPFLKFLSYFWGPIPWMIEVAVILSGVVRHWPDFFIILLLLVANAVVGFWEERQAGNAIAALKAKLAIKARVKRDGKWVNSAGARAGAGRRHPVAPGRYRAGGCAAAGGRSGRGGSVRADRRIPARHAQSRRGGIFRLDHSPGRDRRAGLCHGHKHLFRQDGRTGAEAHTVSHFQRAVLKIGNYLIVLAVALVAVIVTVAIYPRRSDPHHVAVRPGADRRRDSRGDADGAVGDDGGRRAPARQESRRSSAGWWPSRNWRAWTCCARTRPAR